MIWCRLYVLCVTLVITNKDAKALGTCLWAWHSTHMFFVVINKQSHVMPLVDNVKLVDLSYVRVFMLFSHRVFRHLYVCSNWSLSMLLIAFICVTSYMPFFLVLQCDFLDYFVLIIKYEHPLMANLCRCLYFKYELLL